jgi:hypothetical protein
MYRIVKLVTQSVLEHFASSAKVTFKHLFISTGSHYLPNPRKSANYFFFQKFAHTGHFEKLEFFDVGSFVTVLSLSTILSLFMHIAECISTSFFL